MDPAFELLPLPAAGARVRRIEGRRCARLAPDAGEAIFVQRKQRDVVRLCVVPDVFGRPGGERTDFLEDLASWQGERLDFGEVRPRWRLVAAQSSEPHVVRVE